MSTSSSSQGALSIASTGNLDFRASALACFRVCWSPLWRAFLSFLCWTLSALLTLRVALRRATCGKEVGAQGGAAVARWESDR
eukprot:scaffold17805_cov116-Isochrysis_galbana.AAC.3